MNFHEVYCIGPMNRSVKVVNLVTFHIMPYHL